MTKLIELFKQFFKFGIVGVINTLSAWLFYYPLIYIHVNYIVATTIAFILSSIIGYMLNNKWVFKKNVHDYRSVIKYYLVYGSSYLINIGTMYLWVDVLKISEYIAPILTLLITVPYNFIFSKLWVFAQKENKYLKDPKKYHSFAICAYKESPYLEEAIKSIVNQTVKTNVIMASSTRNKYIENLAKKYNIKLYYRDGKSDIQDDWNFAVSKTKTELVTVAHQDDVYGKYYVENILSNYTGKESLIFTDNYYYIDGKNCNNKNLVIKKILRIPLRIPILNRFRCVRKFTLKFGSTIQCPAATYNRNIIKGDIFTSDLKMCLDWDTFLKIYNMKALVRYIPLKLMSYRISDESTSKQNIVNNIRYKEDTIMFSKMWPKWIAKIIMKRYIDCYNIYDKKE